MAKVEANPAGMWLIRVLREKPVELKDKEHFTGTWQGVMQRAWLMAHRASFQVNGPHAEVWVSVERFSVRKFKYISVWQAKSRCTKDAKAK